VNFHRLIELKCPIDRSSSLSRVSRINEMSKITYRVVKHDGGWAYEANGTYSEQFQTREAARKAARLAATAKAAANEIVPTSYDDKNGQWYDDCSG
jgi:hypothetical protein